MRRRRKARMNSRNKNINQSLDIETSNPCDAPEPQIRQGEKNVDLETVIQYEGIFFCQVIQRLTREIDCARNMDDLADIITLAAKFIQASADKEKAIALSLAASKKSDDPGKNSASLADDLNIELSEEE